MNEPQQQDSNPMHVPRDVLLRRYLLRDLLRCGPCDLPFIAILVPPGARYYGCTSRQCPRRLLPADVTEQRVWSRFVAINETLSDGVPRDQRHELLRQLLKRVVVGRTFADLSLEWRER